jgi:hypothetical protein
MMQAITAPYDVAEFLETPEKMAAYLETCHQESDGDAAFIAKCIGRYCSCQGYGPCRTRVRSVAGCCIRHSQVIGAPVLTRS